MRGTILSIRRYSTPRGFFSGLKRPTVSTYCFENCHILKISMKWIFDLYFHMCVSRTKKRKMCQLALGGEWASVYWPPGPRGHIYGIYGRFRPMSTFCSIGSELRSCGEIYNLENLISSKFKAYPTLFLLLMGAHFFSFHSRLSPGCPET